MKILIIGASGIAGHAIYQELKKDHEVYGTFYQHCRPAPSSHMLKLDLADCDEIKAILGSLSPYVIISCVSGSFDTQRKAHELLTQYCAGKENCRFLFLSSANVFDGADRQVHYEGDTVCAESEYGRFKIECEQMLLSLPKEKAAILRLPFIWSKAEDSRLGRLIQTVRNREPIHAWAPLYTNHTTDAQIAAFVRFLLQERKSGIFHVGTGEACSYLPFIEALLQRLSLTEYTFQIEEMPYPSYLACLPSRPDLPDYLRMNNEDVLTYLSGNAPKLS